MKTPTFTHHTPPSSPPQLPITDTYLKPVNMDLDTMVEFWRCDTDGGGVGGAGVWGGAGDIGADEGVCDRGIMAHFL